MLFVLIAAAAAGGGAAAVLLILVLVVYLRSRVCYVCIFLIEGSPMDRFHWYSLSYIEALRVHICRTESTDVQEQGDLRIVRKEMGFHVIAFGGSSSRISYYPIFTHSVKKRRFLWSYL